MLGEVGGKWLDRLHQHVAKDLRSKGWSQTEIADILGSTQSTISRHVQKPTIQLSASADEAMVDSWASELSQALSSIGPDANVVRQRLISVWACDYWKTFVMAALRVRQCHY